MVLNFQIYCKLLSMKYEEILKWPIVDNLAVILNGNTSQFLKNGKPGMAAPVYTLSTLETEEFSYEFETTWVTW